MAYNHEWPYSDPQRANTDWEINKVKELENKVNLKFDEAIKEFIIANFNTLFGQIAYEAEDQALVFYLGIVGDGEHVYTPANETMRII